MPGLPITSPDITNLYYTVLFDISGAAPSITITNASTLVNPGNLTWWFVITSPSGIPLHQGSLAFPDKTPSAAWPATGTWVMPETWLSPFSYPIIEFSCSVPYNVTVYVYDSVGNTYSYTETQTICKPNGNSVAGYNFGQAQVGITVQCNTGNVYATDLTNYTYQSILGTSASNTWTMVYPADATGSVPPNYIVLNAAYVFIPVGYTGPGYTLNYSTISLYTFPNGCSVKIQYKVAQVFGVWCGIDLCKLTCKMERFYKTLQSSPSQITNEDGLIKMAKVNYLMNMAMALIVQPACQNGLDIHWMVKEINQLIGDGDCGCNDYPVLGVNGSATNGVACCAPSVAAASGAYGCAAPVVTATAVPLSPFFPSSASIKVFFTMVPGVFYELLCVPHPSSTPAAGTTGVTVSSTPYVFTSLLPSTTYDIYVIAYCSAVNASGWVSAGTVTTA